MKTRSTGNARNGRVLFVSLVLFLFACAASRTSFAQTTDRVAQADALKHKGDALVDAKRFDEALAAYDAAYALAPSPSLLYNRGRALDFLARYPEALDAIRGFEKEATPELRARVSGLRDLIAGLESRITTVTIACHVNGARVLVGGRQVGSCPFASPVRVNAGAQALDVYADGYFPYHRDLSLAGGGTESINLALASKDTTALILVKSKVAATNVSIDGRVIGRTPAESGLLPGEHKVTVDHDGYDPATTNVVLKAGDRKELTLDPVDRPSIFGRWWFWTGVGVVVAGVTTTVIAVSTERSPPSGNFSPGTVRF